MIRPLSRSTAAAMLVAATQMIGPSAAVAQATARPAAVTAATSPFLGAWQLDLSRMPATYGPPPARVVYRFEDVGGDRWRTTIDITAPDGSVRHMAVTYRRDGVMAPGEGETGEADSAAILTPAPTVMVMALGKTKALGSVRVYTVSADGREMTEAAANVDGDGRPFVRQFHFTRLR